MTASIYILILTLVKLCINQTCRAVYWVEREAAFSLQKPVDPDQKQLHMTASVGTNPEDSV